MKHIYFQVIDISKQSNSLEFAYFGASPICYDIAGYVTDMARRNNSSIEYIRLFIFASKKEWSKAKTEWINNVNSNNRAEL